MAKTSMKQGASRDILATFSKLIMAMPKLALKTVLRRGIDRTDLKKALFGVDAGEIVMKTEPAEEKVPNCSSKRALRDRPVIVNDPPSLMSRYTLNWDDFVYLYYKIMKDIYHIMEKVRRQGIFFIEESIADFGDDEFFKFGLYLVSNFFDGKLIQSVLSTKLEQVCDPYKHTLRRIQMEGIIGIQQGEYPVVTIIRLNSLVDIPDNKISSIIAKYYTTGCDADVFDEINTIQYEFPKEREETRFIYRALTVAIESERNGLLSLDGTWDEELISKGDVFECGLSLVVDGESTEFIETILDSLIAREYDPWKKRLARAKKAAVLSIQNGDNLFILQTILWGYFDRMLDPR
jgi:flagellar motor component MotA